MVRDHALFEQYLMNEQFARKYKDEITSEIQKQQNEVDDFYYQLNKYRQQGELKHSEISRISEAFYEEYLTAALEAVYISALQPETMTNREIAIAKANIKNYIKENGGAKSLMNLKKGKTSVLDSIFGYVQEAHDNSMQRFLEADEEDKKEKEADGSDEVDKEDIKLGDNDKDGVDDSIDSDFGTGTDNKEEKKEDKKEEEKSEESSEDKDEEKNLTDDLEEDEVENVEDSEEKKEEEKSDKEEETSEKEEDKEEEKNLTDDLEEDEESSEEEKSEESEKEEEKEGDSDDAPTPEGDSDPEASEESEDSSDDEKEASDDTEKAIDEPVSKDDADELENVDDTEVEDATDENISGDKLDNDKEDMFNKMEKDMDVNDAVELISKRIADAESKFIENNAKDKQKIENIVDKVNNRIKAATGMDEESSEDNTEEKSEEETEKEVEAVKAESTRMITEIRENRPHTIFEEMVRSNTEYIMKSSNVIKESYLDEDGKIDMENVISATKVMYGFLEFVNTMKLEKVDERYLEKVLRNEI